MITTHSIEEIKPLKDKPKVLTSTYFDMSSVLGNGFDVETRKRAINTKSNISH